jgi:hypothetical protein
MKLIIRRTLELGTLVGLYVGAVLLIEASHTRQSTPTPPPVAEVKDRAPAHIEELPAVVVEVRDPEPVIFVGSEPAPAAAPVSVQQAIPVEAAQPAKPVPQPVPQQPQQWQCPPVCQPEPACRRGGFLRGLFHPFSDE